MIAKAKAISHGINDIRYITGESHNKKHPEKIYRVLDNMMPSELDAMGVWNSMQFTLSRFRPVKNSLKSLTNRCSKTRTRKYETVRPIWPTANTQSGSIWNPIAEFRIFMLLSAGWMKTERLTTTTIYTFVPSGQQKEWQRNVDGQQQNRKEIST